MGGSRCRERKKTGREARRRKVENMRWKKGGFVRRGRKRVMKGRRRVEGGRRRLRM